MPLGFISSTPIAHPDRWMSQCHSPILVLSSVLLKCNFNFEQTLALGAFWVEIRSIDFKLVESYFLGLGGC